MGRTPGVWVDVREELERIATKRGKVLLYALERPAEWGKALSEVLLRERAKHLQGQNHEENFGTKVYSSPTKATKQLTQSKTETLVQLAGMKTKFR